MKEQIIYSERKLAFDENYCEKVVEDSIEKFEQDGIQIGFGRTANVLVSKIDTKICMKAVQQEAKRDRISCNDVGKEMHFLDLLSAKGIRVPRPVCAVTTSRNDYLFMETIEGGISIEDVINGDLADKIPADFDFKKFFSALKDMVERMHAEKIYHRDLHAGNIMIDSGGQPVIIDFGDATTSHLSSEDPYVQPDVKKGDIRFKKDEDNLRGVYRDFSEYLKEKNIL